MPTISSTVARQLWRTRKVLRFLAWFVFVPLVALGTWLTLKTSPDLHLKIESIWIEWFNRYGVLRNLPAYYLIAFAGFAAAPYRGRYWMAGWLAFLATGLEIAQLWIPTRTFDWRDIALSYVGIYLGGITVSALREVCLNATQAAAQGPHRRP